MPPSRCVLCNRLLMGPPAPSVLDVTNPEALVLCILCEALPPADRRERRSQMMVRMLDDARPLRRRAS